VLPLGALAVIVCVVLWPVARRFSQRRPGSPQPSE
jgi:predicted PurR-regulated permease PerM